MSDVIVFDLYGVIARTQTAEAVRRIEELAGTPGPAFWDAYWACRPAYDAARRAPPTGRTSPGCSASRSPTSRR